MTDADLELEIAKEIANGCRADMRAQGKPPWPAWAHIPPTLQRALVIGARSALRALERKGMLKPRTPDA